MITQQTIELPGGTAEGYVVPLGSVNLVFAVTRKGLIGCGAFDVKALDRFGYPAARLKGAGGAPIATIEDLLAGAVRETNAAAAALGISEGMTGREALQRLQA